VISRPDWKGKIEVAGWIKKDKNGKEFITIKLGDGVYFNLFKNDDIKE